MIFSGLEKSGLSRDAHNVEIPGSNPGPATILNNVVYGFWDSSPTAVKHQAELVSLWRASWLARGWSPRLLTVRDALKSAQYKAARKLGPVPPQMLADFACNTVGSGFLCPLHCINFSLQAPSNDMFASMEFFKQPGWERAGIVDFDHGVDPEVIRTCGRAI